MVFFTYFSFIQCNNLQNNQLIQQTYNSYLYNDSYKLTEFMYEFKVVYLHMHGINVIQNKSEQIQLLDLLQRRIGLVRSVKFSVQ